MQLPEDGAFEAKQQEWGLVLPDSSKEVERYLYELHDDLLQDLDKVLEHQLGDDDAQRAYYETLGEDKHKMYLRLRNNIRGLVHVTYNRFYTEVPSFNEAVLVEDYLIDMAQGRIANTVGTVRRMGPDDSWTDGTGLGPLLYLRGGNTLKLQPLDQDYSLVFKTRLFGPSNSPTTAKESELMHKLDRIERMQVLLDRLWSFSSHERIDDITF